MKETHILTGPKFTFEFPKDICLAQVILDSLITYQANVAQVQRETNEQLTFKTALESSLKFAVYLRSIGIKPNDRLAICSENSLGWIVPLCATLFVGGTVCPINHMYSKKEFCHTLNISKPKFIFVSPAILSIMKNVVKELSWSPTLILMKGPSEGNIPSVEKLIENIPAVNPDDFQIVPVNQDEHIVAVLCSSGTTGLPKGVMLTNKNYLAILQVALSENSSILPEAGNSIICILPFFHSYCFSVLIMGIIGGICGIVFSQFNEKAFLETIEKHRIKILTVVPPIMVFLAKHPMVDKYDLSSIEMIWCGAAPLSAEVEEAVKKRLKNVEVRQGYGMTEATLTVLKTPGKGSPPGTAGKLVPGIQAKVIPVDESDNWSDKTLGPYCEGELCFKGNLIMKGYLGDVNSTAATIDKDGWLHTGDVGYYNKDGFFFIVDRVKELIKYKAFQVPPAELEAILLNHSEIKDAAVVGKPDEIAGELPLAFVVRQPNAKITEEEIVKYVNDRVSNQKRLRGGVRFVESIPKNPSGKILRRELRNVLKSKL